MKVRHKYGLLIIAISFSINMFGQSRQDTTVKLIKPTLGYICDAGRNFTGGIKKGNAFMGLAYAGFTLYSDKVWKGGALIFTVMNTHGHNLSANYVGDLQVISNIENGDYTFIEELMYRQDFSKLSLLVGLQDLNAEFSITKYGCCLTNSSFGIQSTFPLNFGVPLYPKTALAFVSLYTLNDNIIFRASLWDGDAGSLEDDPHNLDWSITSEGGLLTVEEIEIKSSSEKLADIKAGVIYHSGEFIDTDDDTSSIKGNMGYYAIFDKQLYKSGSPSIGLFGQFSIFPSKANYNKTYIGGGLTFSGMIEKRPDDCLAAGIACSRLFNDAWECDIELNYCFTINSYISLQPALHYIINPGADQGLNNAFAGFLRFSAGF